MKRQAISSPHLPKPPPQTWSTAIRVGDVLYVSGTTSRGPDGETVLGKDEYEQTKVIFTKIRHAVEAAGGTINDVSKMTIFVTNIKKNTEVWRARKEFFTGDFPASTLVEVRALAKPEILLEIEVVAHIGSSAG
ncbi:MAG: enamine deaminase RidA [Acidobacteria bacterium RIFCSPLOWO2_02_FULL_59_13]|nr:MAG: enamine deaminase RidA [Acidobacteria bacterium RIFCSPLOWO2_02_FULL_59_13]OGA56330.1 MAG: enamine deaminase RidA [Betaproteobacteria bacterium RIFCSPLOWO2_12_FULL_65_14]